MFIRLEKIDAKPVACGECMYTFTLAAAGTNHGQQHYAEQRLAKWYAEQAAFHQASKLEVSPALKEAFEKLTAEDDEVPF